ncbi:hypothetical protein TruAng_007232 [Truncatella angustata]|nr:hypothetical protein TruAng_007232 [Truncatella angustata]
MAQVSEQGKCLTRSRNPPSHGNDPINLPTPPARRSAENPPRRETPPQTWGEVLARQTKGHHGIGALPPPGPQGDASDQTVHHPAHLAPGDPALAPLRRGPREGPAGGRDAASGAGAETTRETGGGRAGDAVVEMPVSRVARTQVIAISVVGWA